MDEQLSDDEVEFYVRGFLRVLRRYRSMTILGWGIVVVGFASVPIGWKFGMPHGVVDLVLSGAAMLAGILVVQQAVMALESYVGVPFRTGEAVEGRVSDLVELTESVREGGWREASAAIRKLESGEPGGRLSP